MKHSDPLYEVANAVSAIQGAAKRLPFSLRNSILQDYLTRKLDDEPWETRMRLLGLVSQELREVHPRYTNQNRKPHYFQVRFYEVYDKPTESTRKTAAEIEALHQLEKRLLHQYSEYRNPELRIRGYLKDILEEFQDLQEFFISGGKVGVLLEKPCQGDQSMIVPSFQTVLNLKTKSGFGVLHCAAYHDNVNVIRCLLEPGSEYQVNGKAGTAGYTALHIAAARGNIASIRALLEGGADPNMASNGELGCHLTPLALLVLWCSDSERLSGAVKVLAGYGADFSRTIGGRLTLAHMAAGRPTSKCLRETLFYVPGLSNVPDVYHRTPLHVAAEEGRLENVQLLLQLGANPNQIDYEGKTPLDLAKTTNTDNDRGFTLGIGSDFSYGLLRNQFTAVSREEYGAVIDYLGKSMKADRGKTTAHEQKGVEAQVGLSKSKSNMVLDSRGPTFKFAVADALRIPRGVLELPLPE